MHHNSNSWTTPGGHIEKWEGMHKALKREMKEECNIKIKILGKKDNFELENIKEYPLPIANYKIYYNSKKFGEIKKWEFIFHAQVQEDSLKDFKIQEKEIKDSHWFSPEEIFELENIFPQIPMLLKKVMSS